MNSANSAEKPLGYFQITGIDAAVTIASKLPGGVIPAGCTRIVMQCEAQAIRWRDDGVAPTTTVGQPMAVGAAPYLFESRGFSVVQVISQVAGAILNCTFYGMGM